MFWNVTLTLLSGLGTTIQIFFLTLLFALPLGLVIAFGSMSRLTPRAGCATPWSGLSGEPP